MLRFSLVILAFGSLAIFGCSRSSDKPKVDPNLAALPARETYITFPATPAEKEFKTTGWRWSEREASLLYSAQYQITGYEVQIIRRAETKKFGDEPFTVRILRDGKQLYSFSGHHKTVFLESGDVIYVAEFSPIATGCTLVAYDLVARKERWRCSLKGNPPQGHSKYSHHMIIANEPNYVVVYGSEDNGRYIEHIDKTTGKTTYNKKLPPDGSAP